MTEQMIDVVAERIELMLGDAGRWLVLTRPGTKQFVQLSCTHRRSSGGFDDVERVAIIDQPCKALTWDESDRAGKWFTAHSVAGPSEEFAIDNQSERKVMLATWKYVAGSDAKLAARLAVELFETVHQLSGEYQLLADEGYDG